jgi:predicted phage terminase large subunit-like protein
MNLSEYESGLQGLIDSIPADQHIAAFRELCRSDLYFLLVYGMGRQDMRKEWLFQRCVEIQASPDGFIDLWAREHYKSTIITYGKTIQDILASHGEGAHRPECTFGIFSHTRPIAKGFLRQIKRELEGNRKLKEWFPDVLWDNPAKESPKWSEDDGIIVRRKTNPKECTVEAWGVVDGQPIGKHFDYLIYDDIVTRESVNTPDMIAKTMEMLELSYNLGAGEGKRRFIGTRYHFNDPYATIMARLSAVPRLYPATADGAAAGEPVLLTRELLDKKRRDMGEYTFSCQMLQNPVADDMQGFRREWIQYHNGINDSHLAGMNVYIVVDPANSKRRGSDYTSAWVIALGRDLNYYVIDMVRDRLSLNQRCKLVMDWHRKYKPMRSGGVRYEKYGMMADIDALKQMMDSENYRFEITEVGGQTPKTERIGRLMSPFENKRFYFPTHLRYTGYDGKTRDLVQVFIEEEYRAFPVSVHDDMLDSLARICEPDIPLVWPKLNNQKGSGLQQFAIRDWKFFS